MPPKGKLSGDEIDSLKHWLAIGAPWPAPVAGSGQTARPGSVSEADRQFWSFQPIRDHVAPAVRNASWSRRPLDHFILAQLEAADLGPVEAADPRTFIRRATYDLTGLPATAEEVDAFVAACADALDGKPQDSDPYAVLVDRLLASPHYGERWARHWLDLARYGEDQAHSFQPRMYTGGYRYRDWIVAAFNGDLPYDRFVTEQLAGDLLADPADTPEVRRERAAALGFVALGPVYYAGNPTAKMGRVR